VVESIFSFEQNRLLLLGGAEGLTSVARSVDKVKLDIKTFSQILFCIQVRQLLKLQS